MQFKVKAKTMFIDGEANKTRDHGEVFVVSADRYALMDEKKLVELIEEIEEQKPAEEETKVVVAEPAEEPAKPKRSRKTTKDDA
ncbi:MAG: hypothetical protein EOM48_05000 [Bacilli bacterium]|nr:hypothetical protein [Bacilli bacterium]